MPEDRRIRGFLIHLVIYIVVIAALAVLNVTRNPSHLWVLWVAGGWGIGVVLHGFLAYRRSGGQRTETPERVARHSRP